MKPYTYLIGWSKLNLWYYGVRYSPICEPSDLWVKYFTSSRVVAAMRLEQGEPDVIEVRRVFASAAEARAWEFRVLKRIGAVKSGAWLNKANANKEFIGVTSHTLETRERMRRAKARSKYVRGPMSDATKAKISAANKGNLGIIAAVRGRKHTDDVKEKIGAAKRGVVKSDETRARLSLAHTGKKQSPETIAKRAAGRIGMKYKSKAEVA